VADNSFGDDDEEEDEEVPGKVKTRVVFQPTFDTTHTIYYKGHWLRVRRGRKTDGSNCEVLSIRFVILFHLLLLLLLSHGWFVGGLG
jgi:chaperone BCS1